MQAITNEYKKVQVNTIEIKWLQISTNKIK